MQVREAMSSNPKTITIHDSLKSAAAQMRDADIGMVLVEDDSGDIRGILTDRDIAIRAVAEGVNPDREVADCVTQELISCHESDSVEDAAKLMEQEQVRRLLVRDEQERPVGVIAQGDLARAMGRSPLVGETVQEISQPGEQHRQH